MIARIFNIAVIFSFLAVFFIIPSSFSAPAVTVEKNPQRFNSPAVVETTISNNLSLEELKNMNENLKNNVALLSKQVDNLSNEMNALKTTTPSQRQFSEIIQEEWQLLSMSFGIILIFVLFMYLILSSSLKKMTQKDIHSNVESMIENTKNDLLKDFKMNENNFDHNTLGVTKKKLQEFEESLNSEYNAFVNKISSNIEQEMEGFKQNVEHLIKRRVDKFTFELESQFEETKTDFMSQIEEKFPPGDLNAVLTKLVEEEGLIKNLSEQLEINVSEMVEKESETILKQLSNYENTIIADIQKVHLANNHFNIGNIFSKNKNYSEAIEEFNEAIKIDPNFYGSYINLGKAYENTEQYEDAIETYNKAIQVRQGHYKAYFNLGNLLNKMENYEKAIEVFKVALELKPDYEKIYNNIGITYHLLGKLEDAKEYFEKAINLNNNYADAYLNLSKVESEADKSNNEMYSIAEKHMNKYNASEETYSTVKELVQLQNSQE